MTLAGVIEEAGARFGLTAGKLRPVHSFESYVAEGEQADRPVYLKIIAGDFAAPDLVAGEVDWVNYLASGGVPVVRALPSRRGRLVEVIRADRPAGRGDRQRPGTPHAGDLFSAVVFERATGVRGSELAANADLFREYGRIAGLIHELTVRYEPPSPRLRRPDWEFFAYASTYQDILPPAPRLIEGCRDLIDRTRSLPRDAGAYGLVHGDLHDLNFLVDGHPAPGRVRLIDCADCHYDWFAADIAVALFHVLRRPETAAAALPERNRLARVFMKSFTEGYSQNHRFEASWLQEIPHFLKLREMILYVTLHEEGNLEDLDPWSRSFMVGRRESIESGAPIVDMDLGF